MEPIATFTQKADLAPEPQRVARRALAMCALTARAILEQDKDNPQAEFIHQDIIGWTETIGIGDEFEPREWEILQCPLRSLGDREMIDSAWRLEGLVVLAWALGRFEIPPHDRLVDFNTMWQNLAFLDPEGSLGLLSNPTLRPRQELATLRNRLFALHWRLRKFQIDAKPINFVEFAPTFGFSPLDLAGLPMVDDDLAIDGQRIDQAKPDRVDLAISATMERHQAANWLWEGPERYSVASVAT